MSLSACFIYFALATLVYGTALAIDFEFAQVTLMFVLVDTDEVVVGGLDLEDLVELLLSCVHEPAYLRLARVVGLCDIAHLPRMVHDGSLL